jgi:hypothetical protein
MNLSTNPSLSQTLRAFVVCLLLWVSLPKTARTETSLTVKAQSWQEDKQRIRVDSQYALVDADLTTSTHLKLMGLIDTIAGATPTGEKPTNPGDPVPLANMEDRRKAWSLDCAHQFSRINVTLGYANSRESDYVSNGWSLNTVTDFNDKNTGLLLGYGHTDDTINEEKLGWTVKRPKTGNDFLIGLNQLLDPGTSISANFSFGTSRGT